MKPIPLFGTGIRSYSSSITAQRRLNCFYDIRQDGDKTQIVIRGTPGSVTSFSLPEAPIRGWRVIGSLMYVVAGAGVYTVSFGGVVVFLGAIINSGQLVSMSDDSVRLIIVDGQQGYTVLLPSGAPALITDVNFPNGCTSVTTLNSRFVAEVPGSRSCRQSALLDGTNWIGASGAMFFTKENASDLMQAVDVVNGTLVLFGYQNMEFWQDVGSAPVPYQRINGASQT